MDDQQDPTDLYEVSRPIYEKRQRAMMVELLADAELMPALTSFGAILLPEQPIRHLPKKRFGRLHNMFPNVEFFADANTFRVRGAMTFSENVWRLGLFGADGAEELIQAVDTALGSNGPDLKKAVLVDENRQYRNLSRISSL